MFIYVLKDPDTKIVCYVGKTNNPTKRLSSHFSPEAGNSLPSTIWIKKLKTNNKKPVMEIIEETDDWESCERKWIAFYRNENKDLLNVDEGGVVHIYKHKVPRGRKSKKFMSVIQRLSKASKRSITKEVSDFWNLVRKCITKTRRYVYCELGEDAVNYFDDCIYAEFVERKPMSFRVLQ